MTYVSSANMYSAASPVTYVDAGAYSARQVYSASPTAGRVFDCPPELFAKMQRGEALTPEEVARITGEAAAPVASGTQAPAADADPAAKKASEKKDKKEKKTLKAESKKKKGCC